MRQNETVLVQDQTQEIKPLETDPLVIVNSDLALAEVNAKINEKIEKCPDGTFSCGVCGRNFKLKGDIKRHVETHIEGISFPCKSCDKAFSSRHSLSSHRSQYHRFQS